MNIVVAQIRGALYRALPTEGRGESPPTSQKFAHPPPPGKFPPQVDSPHQVFIPPPHQGLIPPLNNNFHVITH